MTRTRAFPERPWLPPRVQERALISKDHKTAGTVPVIALQRAYPPATWKAAFQNNSGSPGTRENHGAGNKHSLLQESGAPALPECGHQNRTLPRASRAMCWRYLESRALRLEPLQ